MADGNPNITAERTRELLTSAAPYDASLLGYEEGPTREDHTELVFYPHRHGSSYRLSHEGYSVELPELIAEQFAKEILEDVARRKALKGRAA